MKREVIFEETPYGSVWMTDICGGSNHIVESFEGGDGTGARYFRLDGNGISYFCKQDDDAKKLYTVYDIVVRDDGSTLDLFRALDDKPGSLARAMQVLSDGGIDLEYMYAFLSTHGYACAIVRVSDNETAEQLLKDADFKLLTQQELGKL